jgi:glycosyltransferase involved in cell wall biosynthesis
MLGKVRSNVKNADYIVCISEYAKQSFIRNKRLFTFTKLKDIVVIHNGIHLPEHREYQLGKYSYLKDKKYILNIGVLFNKKNQLTLVDMLPYIKEDLVLIASDEKQPYADDVRRRIKELHLEQRFISSEIFQRRKSMQSFSIQRLCVILLLQKVRNTAY